MAADIASSKQSGLDRPKNAQRMGCCLRRRNRRIRSADHLFSKVLGFVHTVLTCSFSLNRVRPQRPAALSVGLSGDIPAALNSFSREPNTGAFFAFFFGRISPSRSRPFVGSCLRVSSSSTQKVNRQKRLIRSAKKNATGCACAIS